MALTRVRTGGITDANITAVKVANNALNVPAFHVTLGSSQTISNASSTKINFNTESFDSDGTYDNSSNYRFTPAVAGKYYLYASLRLDSSADFNNFQLKILKNASTVLFSNRRHLHYGTNFIAGVIDSDTDDYFHVEVYLDSGSDRDVRGNAHEPFFGGFRITT